MKNQVAVNKKIVLPTTQKKTFFSQNSYNDLPSSQVLSPTAKSPVIKTSTMNKLVQKQKVEKKLEMSKSPAAKPYKLVSPDIVRTVGLSTNSNDSTNKVKIRLADSKKLPIKQVKVAKYNDYFDMEEPGGKKQQVNASKKSTIQTIVLSNLLKVRVTNSFFLRKIQIKQLTNRRTQNHFLSLPFTSFHSLATKPLQTGDGTKIQPQGINNVLNNMPASKTNKSGDDRKSWSYSN